VHEWRRQLLDLRAEIEARLDFADEGDVADMLPASWRGELARLEETLDQALESVSHGQIVREGFRVALAGLPNAGKSSLLNALARSDLAIVSAEEGTTRDIREVPLDIDGHLVILVDMAGLRESGSAAETEGVRRAQAEIDRADLVLWLEAPDNDIQEPAKTSGAVWRVATKSDLSLSPGDFTWSISATSGHSVLELMRAIGAEAGKGTRAVSGSVLLSRERDRAALGSALEALKRVEGVLDQPELAAEELRRASHALARLLGEIDAEAILDQLFSSFCIGK
jgi:tRNA modification GTPase